MSELFWLIPLLPGVGALINGLAGISGRPLSRPASYFVACGSVLASFFLVLMSFFSFVSHGGELVMEKQLFSWIPAMGLPLADGGYGLFNIAWEYRLDSLSMVMVLVVTGIGFLIHVYSTGYMAHDEGYWKFFTYLNMFMFFMLNLVLGASFLLAFVGWEGVGLCSYLLIGFWFERESAANAGKKAFIVNRIGDAGFIMAMMLIFVNFGSLDFYEVMQSISERFDAPQEGWGLLAVIGVLLFVGACGKSAQIPLYVWLPDAMEGPTPVSALIHAATMVTAGVYMTARCSVLYTHAPSAMMVVATVGAMTALFAATIGLFQNDIKKVLAYSTVSQLGYMFLGCGVGAFAAGVFHLMTHAFFKACLFLGSGSVIHAMEHAEHASGGHRDYTEMQDMRNMGGLKKYMPLTFWTYFISTGAIAGIPFLSGFFSKDEILWAASHHGQFSLLWVMGVIAAGMTAFYMSRQVLLTFYGKFRGGDEMESKLHESVPAMTYPLVVLAAGAVFAGYLGVPQGIAELVGFSNVIEHFLEPALNAGVQVAPIEVEHHLGTELLFMAISVAVAVGGIFLAINLYRNNPDGDRFFADRFAGAHRLLYNKYYVDEIYDATVVRGTLDGAEALNVFDAKVVDGVVNGAARVTLLSADVSALSDVSLVDGAVNFVASFLAAISAVFRRVQTGVLQNYALLMLFGVFALVGFFYFFT